MLDSKSGMLIGAITSASLGHVDFSWWLVVEVGITTIFMLSVYWVIYQVWKMIRRK